MDVRIVRFSAVAASFALAAAADAGLATGVLARRTDTNPGGSFTEQASPGSSFGHYKASVTDASAQLSWFASTCTFTGSASGGDGIIAKSEGIALYAFAEETSFSISYALSAAIGAGNTVGWALVDVVSGDFIFGLSFEGTTASAVGGVSSAAAGSFTGTIAAGTYVLVAAAECTAPGGFFAYDAAFTPVPAPGAAALLGAAMLLPRRRR
jgi:hypothetical protein